MYYLVYTLGCIDNTCVMKHVYNIPHYTHYRLLKMTAGGSVRSFCHHRLVLLEQKFNLHVMLNADKEFLAQKTVGDMIF